MPAKRDRQNSGGPAPFATFTRADGPVPFAIEPEHRSVMTRRQTSDSNRSDSARIFVGGGEMGRLCRALDWSETPLGPVEDWPQSLRTAAGMVLEQGIAQSLCWGPDLVQVYNDGYRVIMGDKHPEGLGRSVLLNWAEIEYDIGRHFSRVRARALPKLYVQRVSFFEVFESHGVQV